MRWRDPRRELAAARSYAANASLADRRAAPARVVEIGAGQCERDECDLDCLRLDAKAKRERAQNRQLRAASTPSRSAGGIGFGVAAARALRSAHRSNEQPAASICDRTTLVVPFRIADDACDAIAGEPFADRPNDRHRAADGRFEPQLSTLPRRQRLKRGAVTRDRLLVRR